MQGGVSSNIRIERNFSQGLPHGQVRHYSLAAGRSGAWTLDRGVRNDRAYRQGKLISPPATPSCPIAPPPKFSPTDFSETGECPDSGTLPLWGENEQGVPTLRGLLSCGGKELSGTMLRISAEGIVEAEGTLSLGKLNGKFTAYREGKPIFSLVADRGAAPAMAEGYGTSFLFGLALEKHEERPGEGDSLWACLCRQGDANGCEFWVAGSLFRQKDEDALLRLAEAKALHHSANREFWDSLFTILDPESTEKWLRARCRDNPLLCPLKDKFVRWNDATINHWARERAHLAHLQKQLEAARLETQDATVTRCVATAYSGFNQFGFVTCAPAAGYGSLKIVAKPEKLRKLLRRHPWTGHFASEELSLGQTKDPKELSPYYFLE